MLCDSVTCKQPPLFHVPTFNVVAWLCGLQREKSVKIELFIHLTAKPFTDIDKVLINGDT